MIEVKAIVGQWRVEWTRRAMAGRFERHPDGFRVGLGRRELIVSRTRRV